MDDRSEMVYWRVVTNRATFYVLAENADRAEEVIHKWHGRVHEVSEIEEIDRPDNKVIWTFDRGAEDGKFDDGRPALGRGGDLIRLVAEGAGMSSEEAYEEGALWEAADPATRKSLKRY